MSGKANGKDPDGGAQLSLEEQAQQEFEAGWQASADEFSPDTPSGEGDDKNDDSTPPSGGGEAASASSPSADGEETPPAEADAKAAGEGAKAPDGKEPPPASKEAGKEPDPLDARFNSLKDDILRSVEERTGKSDRELRGQLGRIQKALEGIGRPAAPAAGGASAPQPSATPEKLKERLAKLRETDPETADAIELGFQESAARSTAWEGRFKRLEDRIAAGETRTTQSQEQASAQSRLRALMPDIDFLPLLATDENGVPTHAAFREFLEGRPFKEVQEFWATDEPEPVAKLIRSFEAAQRGGEPAKDTPPANGAAGGGQAGATNGSTQTTEPSADDAKRRLQREAGTGIPGGKKSGADEPPETADDFAAGWKQAGRELAAEKQASANARKAYADSRAGHAGI